MGKRDDSDEGQSVSERGKKASEKASKAKWGSIDWEHGKLLYARGCKLAEIAEALGTTAKTVSVKAAKGGWREDKERANESVKKIASKTIENAAQSAAEEWSNMMMEDLRETASVIRESHKPRNLHDLKTYEEVRKLHVETGRKLFGLDEADNKTLVQVNLGNLQAEDAPQGDSSTNGGAIEA